jgi:hypothetical protein
MKDVGVRASVLCQLGTVLIADDLELSLKHLKESVELREQQVRNQHDR